MSDLGEIHLFDFFKTCRICLNLVEGQPELKNTNLETFSLLTGTELFADECLPHVVCKECINKLDEIYCFIDNYKQNEIKLRDMLKHNSISDNPDKSLENTSISNENNDRSIDMENPNKKGENGENISMMEINDINSIEIVCNTCDRTFLDVKDLINHERFNPICFQGNNSHNDLGTKLSKIKKHKAADFKHVNVTPNCAPNVASSFRTDCLICNRAFPTEKEFQNHQRFNPRCRVEFVNEDVENVQKNIQLNQILIENAVQNFGVETLPLNTKILNNIKKGYPCGECGKAFKNKWCYERHMKSHNSERPHVCEVCKKGFKQKAHLKDHMRSHSGEKPFQCFICNKSFRHLSSITKHRHKHIEVA